MPLSKEQAEDIKKQLLKQVDQLPNENKDQIKEYIKGLNEQGLEEFLKQNNIKYGESAQGEPSSQGAQPSEQQGPQKPIFQQIVEGEIPSYKIAENDKAMAILEINPLSKGHSLILPRKQVSIEKLPKSALTLAQKVASRIKKKFGPEDIKIETSSFQDYPMINIIPIYKDTKLEKTKAEEDVLKFLQNKLETKTRAKRPPRVIKEDTSKLPRVGFRIP